MPSEKLLRKYARLVIQKGVNVQKGQLLVINSDVTQYQLARMCMEEAYQYGAGEVWIHWYDQEASRLSLQYADTETLCKVAEYQLKFREETQKRRYCTLSLVSDVPGLFAGIDPVRMGKVSQAKSRAFRPYQTYTMNNLGQWCVAAAANPAWARKVFPALDEKEAEEALWKAIFATVCLKEDNDVIADWTAHGNAIKEHCRILNDLHLEKLHYTNSLGTDLTVHLSPLAIWGGGSEKAVLNQAEFDPNMPTEEVFTTPMRNGVDGKVYSSRPLDLDGQMVENFSFTFRNGLVTDFTAEKGKDALQHLLDTDEGSRRLGEAALVAYDSPISQMNLLFYNTLFDENASCHLALGACYPTQLQGGGDMSEEDLLKQGGNISSVHVDFMFGTRDMEIVGTDFEGKETVIFHNGNFAFQE